MYRYIALIMMITVSCNTSNNITEKEFMISFDSGKTIATANKYFNNGWWLHYYVDGVQYSVLEFKNCISYGYQYWVLYDKENPRENYKILWHKPIIPINVDYEPILGEIIYLKKDVEYIIVEYKIELNSKKKKYLEYIPLKYYSKVEYHKDNQKSIPVNIYKVPFEGKINNRPLIDVNSLN